MAKLRKGNAPTITKGPYAGEIVTGDHIIPRSVTPELDNTLFNPWIQEPNAIRGGENARGDSVDRLRLNEGF